MKKKVVTIIFAIFASIFCWSTAFCYSASNSSAGLFCLIVCGIFTFLSYRAGKSISAELPDSPEVINRSTPPGKKMVSQSLQHDRENAPENVTPSDALASPTSQLDQSDIIVPVPKEPDFEFVPIKVAGVTFKNDSGPLRQTILRKIRFRDKPFDKYIDLELRAYEFDGQPAYGVYANNLQIGNIPTNYVQFIHDNIERIESISHIDVYGGGRNEEGYAISYGCKIILRFLKDNPPINIPCTSLHSSDESENDFEFVHVKVAGVTFNNDDGESRQEYLHLIKFERPPFIGSLDISLKQFDWKGEVAYAVYVNDCQIGCVPKSQIAYIHDNFDRIVEIPKINVHGGGQNSTGKDIYFGAEITLKMRNIK